MDKKAWLKAALHKIDTMPSEEFLRAVANSGLEFEVSPKKCESIAVGSFQAEVNLQGFKSYAMEWVTSFNRSNEQALPGALHTCLAA
ncbi:hypothetical protein [Pantoea ananatis]